MIDEDTQDWLATLVIDDSDPVITRLCGIIEDMSDRIDFLETDQVNQDILSTYEESDDEYLLEM